LRRWSSVRLSEYFAAAAELARRNFKRPGRLTRTGSGSQGAGPITCLWVRCWPVLPWERAVDSRRRQDLPLHSPAGLPSGRQKLMCTPRLFRAFFLLAEVFDDIDAPPGLISFLPARPAMCRKVSRGSSRHQACVLHRQHSGRQGGDEVSRRQHDPGHARNFGGKERRPSLLGRLSSQSSAPGALPGCLAQNRPGVHHPSADCWSRPSRAPEWEEELAPGVLIR